MRLGEVSGLLVIFFFGRGLKMTIMPLIKMPKCPICPSIQHGFHILPSLKNFRPRNLKYNTSTNQTNRNAPLLEISPRIPVPVILDIKPITSSLEFPWESYNLKPQLNYPLGRSSKFSSNHWPSINLLKEYVLSCYISYDQRFI